MSFLTIFFIGAALVPNHLLAIETCDKESCQSHSPSFRLDSDKVQWIDDDVSSLWSWMSAQRQKKALTFCSTDKKVAEEARKEGQISRPITPPFKCPPGGSLIVYKGSLDKNKMPNGKGTLQAYKQRHPAEDVCFDILPIIETITGTFKKGYLQGKATIRYEDDSTVFEANYFDGAANGKVRLFDDQDNMISVGQYQAGLAHGPFWFYSRFFSQYVFANFDKGQLIPENVVLLEDGASVGYQGKLVNASFLENPKKVKITRSGEYNCLMVIQTEEVKEEVKERIRLPVKIVPSVEQQRVLIRPSKMMYFNRVAKTGSQSITRLMFELGKELKYLIKPKLREKERMCDWNDMGALFGEVDSILKIHSPMVFVRHYSFINFAKFGYDWHPDWFSMVRDPVDKVISWFYYTRASWNIEDRKKSMKDYEPPPEEYLKKDYESCVLKGDPECVYVDGTDVEDWPGDHRSQIVQFCGHEPFCRLFNNPDALKLAKHNVEKYYPVVGITEQMNRTLALLEKKMPEYFKGAYKMYYGTKEVQDFKHTNHDKSPVSDKVKEMVRANFTLEIEFYEFLKQRFQTQCEEYKIQ